MYCMRAEHIIYEDYLEIYTPVLYVREYRFNNKEIQVPRKMNVCEDGKFRHALGIGSGRAERLHDL